jgi:predicted DNA-binding protein (MmcQ/YjbR family)
MFAAGGENSVTVKSTVEKQAVLIQQPNIEKAAYVGRFGWVTVSVTNDADLDLAFDLIDESYDLVSSKSKKRSKSNTMDERSNPGK